MNRDRPQISHTNFNLSPRERLHKLFFFFSNMPSPPADDTTRLLKDIRLLPAFTFDFRTAADVTYAMEKMSAVLCGLHSAADEFAFLCTPCRRQPYEVYDLAVRDVDAFLKAHDEAYSMSGVHDAARVFSA